MISMRNLAVTCSFLLAGGLNAVPLAAQQSKPAADGAGLFAARCMICHSQSGRASHLDALSRLTSDFIYESLTNGAMKPQSAGMSAVERRAIAEFIAGAKEQAGAPQKIVPCGKDVVPAAGAGTWNGWSPDGSNTRYQPSAAAGISSVNIDALELKWSFVFPNMSSAANQPALLDGRLYIGSWDGTIYSLDPKSGCAHWTFKASSGVRTGIRIMNGLALFGDFQANAYAVNLRTGKLRWKTKVEEHAQARITGTPNAMQGRLFVPVSSLEEGVAADPAYACCTFRGSVVALDIATGKRLWKTYTIDEAAKKTGMNSAGTPRMGPSGVAVWTPPTVDAKRGLVYVSTGNNYTEPDVDAADAIVALDARTGAKRWVRGLLRGDHWNAACLAADKANCPDNDGPDFDFGSAPVLVRLADGSELLLAGQKSGLLYALDPNQQGKLLWELRVGKGASLGGIQWGFATDGARAYVAISDQDVGSPIADGSINAVDLKTGRLVWKTPNPPDACKNRPAGCAIAMAAPVTVAGDVVFVGSVDGHLRSYAAQSGKLLWDYDTLREFTGVNGINGRGGSINAAGATVANGLVFQTSGYGAYGLGIPGNVLLVFGVKK